MYKTIITIASVGLLAGCTITKSNDDDTGETGVEMPPEDPANLAEVWLPAQDELQGLPRHGIHANAIAEPHELEYAAFAPHTPPVPNKPAEWNGYPAHPWDKGVPQIDTHQNYPGVGIARYWPWAANKAENIGVRSGLIGNFGIYLQGVIPDKHPRPPIISQMLHQIGHPFLAGRYNAYGIPCTPIEYDPDTGISENYEPKNFGSNALGSRHCVRWLQETGVSPATPFTPLMGSNQTAIGSMEESVCLHNGGRYAPLNEPLGDFSAEEIADYAYWLSSTTHERQGLVWLNFAEHDDIIGYIQFTLEEYIPFFDWLQGLGFYQGFGFEGVHSRWTWTGVCSVPAYILRTQDSAWSPGGGLYTYRGCSTREFAVYPPFDLNELATVNPENWDAAEQESVRGFCTLPHWSFDPNTHASGVPKPIIQLSKPDTGFHRGYVFDFSAIDIPMLDAWFQGLAFAEVPDGWEVRAITDDGRALLTDLGLEDDQAYTLRSVGDMDMRTSTLEDALAYIEAEFAQGNMLPFWLTLGDEYLPTYIFPVTWAAADGPLP